MHAKELRGLSADELSQKRAELRDQLFHLRLRRAMGQLENPMKLQETKRDLARLETVRSENRLKSEQP